MSNAVTRATAIIDGAPYATRIEAAHHALVADESVGAGGAGVGPSPFHFLLAGLISCTAITLRMYADRKGWTVRSIAVDADYHHATEKDAAWVDRVLTLDGDLDDAARARMADIAERTPVTLAVKAGTDVRTRLATTA
jgi:putative redox protein